MIVLKEESYPPDFDKYSRMFKKKNQAKDSFPPDF